MRLYAVRGEEPPDDAVVVVRGGANGLAPSTIRRTARNTFDEFGFFGVSVFAALDGTVEELCQAVEAIRRYGAVQESTFGALRRAGFPLIATGARPHFDIVLADLSDETIDRLRACFGPPYPTPGRVR